MISKNPYFDNINGRFGFGAMRLPQVGRNIDIGTTTKMIDIFMEAGFNYFDTAHVYHGGKSETTLKKCLTSRYARDKYVLTDKLTDNTWNVQADIEKVIDKELEACGVEYFDFMLMHAMSSGNYPKYKKEHAFETASELKAKGKVKHVGMSFHDNPEVLDMILKEQPSVEVVQIQLNYLDYEDNGVQSKNCLEVCKKYNKPVIVMEPIKGGSLTSLPTEAQEILSGMSSSPATVALRFAEGLDGVMMVLSGMSEPAHVADNVEQMANFRPLSEEETAGLQKVVKIVRSAGLIPCTGCRYCTDGCPMHIQIPNMFALYNTQKTFGGFTFPYYAGYTRDGGKASDCVECGQCEEACPQHLLIRDLLKQVSAFYDNPDNQSF